MVTLAIDHERFKIRGGFSISRGTRSHADIVVVRIQDDGKAGQGECTPYARYGESIQSVIEQIESLRTNIEAGMTRSDLQAKMPAGAARNAIDCALWDLEAKQSGKSAFELAGLDTPQPVETAYTLSLGTPEAMAKAAYENRHRPLLKIKLGGDGDPERLRAVCGHAGSAKIIADANEAWNPSVVWQWLALAKELGVALVEQPLPADQDTLLSDQPHPVPICADESAHDRKGLAELKSRYDVVNIKLDKTGGLTEAIAMAKQAKEMGFGTFIGCMMGSSLAMAPAFLLTSGADYVDLDAPLLLEEDRNPALHFEGSVISPPSPKLWG